PRRPRHAPAHDRFLRSPPPAQKRAHPPLPRLPEDSPQTRQAPLRRSHGAPQPRRSPRQESPPPENRVPDGLRPAPPGQTRPRRTIRHGRKSPAGFSRITFASSTKTTKEFEEHEA